MAARKEKVQGYLKHEDERARDDLADEAALAAQRHKFNREMGVEARHIKTENYIRRVTDDHTAILNPTGMCSASCDPAWQRQGRCALPCFATWLHYV